jgi:hypothetical protein
MSKTTKPGGVVEVDEHDLDRPYTSGRTVQESAREREAVMNYARKIARDPDKAREFLNRLTLKPARQAFADD